MCVACEGNLPRTSLLELSRYLRRLALSSRAGVPTNALVRTFQQAHKNRRSLCEGGGDILLVLFPLCLHHNLLPAVPSRPC